MPQDRDRSKSPIKRSKSAPDKVTRKASVKSRRQSAPIVRKRTGSYVPATITILNRYANKSPSSLSAPLIANNLARLLKDNRPDLAVKWLNNLLQRSNDTAFKIKYPNFDNEKFAQALIENFNMHLQTYSQYRVEVHRELAKNVDAFSKKAIATLLRHDLIQEIEQFGKEIHSSQHGVALIEENLSNVAKITNMSINEVTSMLRRLYNEPFTKPYRTENERNLAVSKQIEKVKAIVTDASSKENGAIVVRALFTDFEMTFDLYGKQGALALLQQNITNEDVKTEFVNIVSQSFSNAQYRPLRLQLIDDVLFNKSFKGKFSEDQIKTLYDYLNNNLSPQGKEKLAAKGEPLISKNTQNRSMFGETRESLAKGAERVVANLVRRRVKTAPSASSAHGLSEDRNRSSTLGSKPGVIYGSMPDNASVTKGPAKPVAAGYKNYQDSGPYSSFPTEKEASGSYSSFPNEKAEKSHYGSFPNEKKQKEPNLEPPRKKRKRDN